MPEEVPNGVDQSWGQGAVLDNGTITKDDGSLRGDPLGDYDIVIVISQSCDVVHGSFEVEPLVEVLIGRTIPEDQVDGNFTWGKNPRTIDFEAEVCGKTRWYRCRISEKSTLGRRVLTRSFPSEALPQPTCGVLARWVAKRYTRAALPDAFNERVRRMDERIKRLMVRDGKLITHVYLSLDTEEELPPNRPYRVIMRATALPEVLEDRELTGKLSAAVLGLKSLLNECDGVEVLDAELESEVEITLHDLSSGQLRRWDYDYLSYRARTPPGTDL